MDILSMRGWFLAACLYGIVLGNSKNTKLEERNLCSRECPVTGLQKLYYFPGKTYKYSYVGSSKVLFAPLNKEVPIDWQAEISLTWLTPCDVVLKVSDPIVHGTQGRNFANDLTKYEMMAVMTEGVVYGVCAHPDEGTETLNVKKGILSAFQNSLNAFSDIYNGKYLMEIDAAGVCDTMYEINHIIVPEGTTIVKKSKDHKKCREIVSPSTDTIESQLTRQLIKNKVSNSTCVQTIEKGFIKHVKCEDFNTIDLSGPIGDLIGAKKELLAIQTSTLAFKEVVDALHTNDFDFRKTDLIYEKVAEKVSSDYIKSVEEILKKIGKATEKELKSDIPQLIDELISNLDKVPHEAFTMFLANIRIGKYGEFSRYIEQIYLDVIPNVENPGALDLIVKLVTGGEVSGFRTPMYIMSMFRKDVVTREMVAYLLPLYRNETIVNPYHLAASKMVYRYCTYYSTDCTKEKVVHDIFDIFSSRLAKSCSTSNIVSSRKEALRDLKSIGNIGRITSNLRDVIMSACIENKNANIPVRMAAIQSFRLMTCANKKTAKFTDLVNKKDEPFEVRITSFVAALPCMEQTPLQQIADSLQAEGNREVASFIWTYLTDIKSSDTPYRKDLATRLVSKIKLDKITRYNVDDYVKNKDYGGSIYGDGLFINMESVMSQGSKLYPTLMNLNITSEISSKLSNLFESNARVENMDPLLKVLKSFIPGFDDEEDDIYSMVESVVKYIEHLISGGHIPYNNLHETNPKDMIQLDWLLRTLGQEFGFISLSDLTMEELKENLREWYSHLITAFHKSKRSYYDATRVLRHQVNANIPTIQGIPIKIQYHITNIAYFNTKKEYSGMDRDSSAVANRIKSFIGFDLGAKVGVSTVHDLNTNPTIVCHDTVRTSVCHCGNCHRNGSSYIANLITYREKTDLITKFPGMPENKIHIEHSHTPRFNLTECMDMPRWIRFDQVCNKIEFANILTDKTAPFGAPNTFEFYGTTKLSVIKRPHLSWISHEESEGFEVLLSLPGDKVSTKFQFEFENRMKKESSGLEPSLNNRKDVGPKAEKENINKMKILLDKSDTKYGNGKEISLMLGRSSALGSEDKYLSLRYTGSGYQSYLNKDDRAYFYMKMRTENKLRKMLNMDLEVTDFAPRKPLQLSEGFIPMSMIDVRLGSGKLQTHSTILKQRGFLDGKSAIEYKTIFTKSSAKTASILMKRVHEKAYKNAPLMQEIKSDADLWFVSTALDVSVQDKQRKDLVVQVANNKGNYAKLTIDLNTKKLNTTLQIENGLKEDANALLFGFDYDETPEHVYQRRGMEISIPGVIHHYEFEMQSRKVDEHTYDIKYAIKKEGNSLISLEGPIRHNDSPTGIQRQADLSLTGIFREPYQVQTTYINSAEQLRLLTSFKSSSNELVSFKVDLSNKASEKEAKLSLSIPTIVSGHLMGEVNKEHFKLKSSLTLLPSRSSQMKIKASNEVDFNKKTIVSQLRYTGRDDFTKEAFVDASYDLSSVHRMVSLRGDAGIGDQSFKYIFQGSLGSAASESPKRHLIIEVMKPSSDNFKLETMYQNQIASDTKGDVTALFDLVTFGKSKYKWESNTCYSIEKDAVVIAGKLLIALPGMKDVVFEMDTKSKNGDQKKHFYSKIKTHNPNGPESLQALVEFKQYSSAESLSKNSLSVTQLILPQEQIKGIQSHKNDFKVEFEAVLPHSPNLQLKAAKSSYGDFNLNLKRGSNSVFECQYTNPRGSDWKLEFKRPERTVEVSANVSPNEMYISLYPDKASSSGHYQIGGKVKRVNDFIYKQQMIGALEGGIGYTEGGGSDHVRYLANVAVERTSASGSLVVSFAPGDSERISVSIEALRLSKGSYKTEAIFKSKSLTSAPRLIFDTAFTESVKSITASFKQGATEPASVAISATLHKQKQILPTTFYGYLKTPKNNFEIASSIGGAQTSPISNVHVNGTLSCNKRTSYDFESNLAPPAFCEVGINKRGEEKRYVASLGLSRNFAGAEIEKKSLLDVKDSTSVVSTFAKLWTHALVLEANYDTKGLFTFVNDHLMAGVNSIMSVASESMNEIVEEILLKPFASHVESVRTKLGHFIGELSTEAESISKDMRLLKFFPSMSNWKQKMVYMLVDIEQGFSEYTEKMKVHLANAMHSISNGILKVFDGFDKGVIASINKIVEDLLHSGKKLKSSIYDMHRNSLREILEATNFSSISDWIENTKKQLSYGEVQIVQNIYNNAAEKLESAKNIAGDLVSSVIPVRPIVKLFKNLFNKPLQNVLESLMEEMAYFKLTSNEGDIKLRLPLKKQVKDIRSAMKSVGMPQISLYSSNPKSKLLEISINENPHTSKAFDLLSFFNNEYLKDRSHFRNPLHENAVATITKDMILTKQGIAYTHPMPRCTAMVFKADQIVGEYFRSSQLHSTLKIHQLNPHSPYKFVIEQNDGIFFLNKKQITKGQEVYFKTLEVEVNFWTVPHDEYDKMFASAEGYGFNVTMTEHEFILRDVFEPPAKQRLISEIRTNENISALKAHGFKIDTEEIDCVPK